MSSDSDSDCSESWMVRASSTPMYYSAVPNNIDLFFKFKTVEKSRRKKFVYTIKKGQKLPYEPESEGFKVKFGMDLNPLMSDEGFTVDKEEKFWVIKEVIPVLESSPRPPVMSPNSPPSASNNEPGLATSPSSSFSHQLQLFQVPVHFDDSFVDTFADQDDSLNLDNSARQWSTEEKDKMNRIVEKVDNSIVPFKCSLCSFVASFLDNCYEHIEGEHRDWNDEPEVEKQNKMQTVHQNPEWKEYFKRNFGTIIVEKLSHASREAIANNEDIKDVRKLKRVRKEVVDVLVEHLVEVHGSVSTPRLSSMREVVVVLGNNYPKMFQDTGHEENQLGYGLGGRGGLKQLPEQLVDKVRHILDKKRKSGGDLVADPEVPKKMGKKPVAYGVDQRKFYSGGRDAEGVAAVAKTSDEPDYVAREEAFGKNRETMQFHFRSSQNQIGKVCKSFFASPGHLDGQFSWLTCVPNLKENVEKNLKPQIGYLEKVLMHENQSLEFKGQIDNINTMVETDYGGASTYKEIALLAQGLAAVRRLPPTISLSICKHSGKS